MVAGNEVARGLSRALAELHELPDPAAVRAVVVELGELPSIELEWSAFSELASSGEPVSMARMGALVSGSIDRGGLVIWAIVQ